MTEACPSPSGAPRAWDRLPEESNRWFMRFERFRLAGPGRTMIAIYNAERVARGLEESAALSGRWRKVIKLRRWVERAEAWDQYLVDQAAAEVEARWQSEIMGKTEILGRLSEQGRTSIHEFFNVVGNRVAGFNMEKFRTHGHLVKKMSQNETANGTNYALELYDGQNALVTMGKHEKLFTDRTEIMLPDGANIQITDERYNRAVSSLAEAIRDSVLGASTEAPSAVDAREQPAMESVSEQGG